MDTVLVVAIGSAVLTVVPLSVTEEFPSVVALVATGIRFVVSPLIPFVAVIVPLPVAETEHPVPHTIAAVVFVPLVIAENDVLTAPEPRFIHVVQVLPETTVHRRVSDDVTLKYCPPRGALVISASEYARVKLPSGELARFIEIADGVTLRACVPPVIVVFALKKHGAVAAGQTCKIHLEP